MNNDQNVKMPGKPSVLKSINRVRIYTKKHQSLIIIGMVLVFLATLISLTGPLIIKEIADLIFEGTISSVTGTPVPIVPPVIEMSKILKFGTIAVSIFVVSFVLSILYSLLFNHVTQRSGEMMRNHIAHKINNLPLNYFDTTSHGDIISRVTNDVDTLASALNTSISSLIGSIVRAIGAITIMFFISWQIALAVLGILPITMILTVIVMRMSQKYFINHQTVLGKSSGFIEESFTGQNIISTYNAVEMKEKEYEEINEDVKVNAWKSQFLSGTLFPILNFTGAIAFVLTCVIGGIMVSKGTLAITAIPIFAIYIRQFNNAVGQIGQQMTSLQSAAASADRVFEFLDAKEMSDESHKTKKIESSDVKGLVEFRNVKFSYTEDREIIHDFSAIAKPGQKIAIVGPTGAGKTTMVNLLMRFYDINAGDILIDDVSIYDMKRETVRNYFGMVLQDTWLFTGTIYENLTYGLEDVPMSKVIEACKSANVHHFIEGMPNGYQMILDENSEVSQGQQQLLTIARAMVQDAPMLILDEATSNVDTRTEHLIQEAMGNLTIGRTSFVIAHRLSTIRNSDLILVMKDGNIIEKGTHDELMSDAGFYTELYNSQFSEEAE